ncbi:MAG: response regulator [Proteobacteria bacterium]|nr:response regulator [Pseudomonadota bacterium]
MFQKTYAQHGWRTDIENVSDAIVYIVDDDDAGLASLRFLIESVNIRTESFSDPVEFLRKFDDNAVGCVILDMRLPNISGTELLRKLQKRSPGMPVIMISAYGGVRGAVETIKCGAKDFFEKPLNHLKLLDSIQLCIGDSRRLQRDKQRHSKTLSRLNLLTDRERAVLQHIVEGKRNKDIADCMNLNIKTVEAHRANMMRKMEASSVVQLVQDLEKSSTPFSLKASRS